ncbi:BnaA08g05880D [Brassica napus]|uniref:BnaA08g05880D protein n=1 Tax=Brassica napus TaxID=3708 RepID=A0A078GDN2_BRANA|nr:BnaA08g05880D [Brassica napus]
MAEQTTADPTFSPALVSVSSPSPPKKENASPVDSKLTELNESRAELLNRILNLKQDLQSWRGKLDTQVQVYREELSGLKKTLNLEVEQLREQDDVSASLKTPGLQDDSKDSKEQMVTEETVEARLTDENAKEAEH